MRSIHSLLVNSRVPVAVIEYNSVCRSKVDSQTASPCGEEKDKYILPVLEVGNHVASLVDLTASVEPHVAVLAVAHVLLQQVDHPSHLTVDQHSVSTLLQPGKQPIQYKELSSI